MAKKVVLLARRSPLNTVKNAEALRQSVGLTLADNQVTALLLDAGAWLAVPHAPDIIGGGEVRKHIDTLLMLKGSVLVERESLERFGVEEGELIPGIEAVSRKEVVAELTSAGAVIAF